MSGRVSVILVWFFNSYALHLNAMNAFRCIHFKCISHPLFLIVYSFQAHLFTFLLLHFRNVSLKTPIKSVQRLCFDTCPMDRTEKK